MHAIHSTRNSQDTLQVTMGPKLTDDKTREAIQRKVYTNLVHSREVASQQQQQQEGSESRGNTSAKDNGGAHQSTSGNNGGAKKDPQAQQRRHY